MPGSGCNIATVEAGSLANMEVHNRQVVAFGLACNEDEQIVCFLHRVVRGLIGRRILNWHELGKGDWALGVFFNRLDTDGV